MKVKTARTILSITWVVGSVPLILFVALQGLNQVYGDSESWDKGWLWIMPLLFPILGTIIGSWSVGHNEVDSLQISSNSAFWLTMLLSLVYFAILYAGMVIGAIVFEHSNWNFVMRSTGWFLGTFQALISIALTKFFIENIHPAPQARISRRERKKPGH
jgi:uncharacterized membrane protein